MVEIVVTSMLLVEITSAEPESVLTAITESGIAISKIDRISDVSFYAYIHKKDFKKAKKICIKNGAHVKIIKRKGALWKVVPLKRRPMLLIGILLLLCMAYSLPKRVLFVQAEGNINIPNHQILEAAELCGVEFGASRKEIRSEKVKNKLLSLVPELQWAGINTVGCTAVISVRERTDTQKSTKEQWISDMISACDGYILSGTVTQGNPLFIIGQTVKQGQLLISGYTDCGILIRGSRAEGEVFAQTNRTLGAVLPAEYMAKGSYKRSIHKISVLFRKKRINLWKDSGISDTSCDRMYKEYYISLPGGFHLPLALCIETFKIHELGSDRYTQVDADALLSSYAAHYLPNQMVAGVIQHADQRILDVGETFRLVGNYTCTEMICREQKVQIGEINGKNS